MRQSLMLRLAVSSLVLIAPIAQAAAPHPAKSAEKVEKLLAKKKLARAVAAAEAAVSANPREAGLRSLLGRAYLQSGRFQSAATSFSNALALDATSGGAALSLALVRIGIGDIDGAATVLQSHGEIIPVADRGLAVALAGNPPEGVRILEEAVRNGLADPKTRQNLALSYALAGRWAEAKLMASYDLDPATLAQRIMDWSRFTREAQAPAQVAALLGVTPGEDAGQPAQLALNAAPAPRLAQIASPPPPARMAEAPAPEPAIATHPLPTFVEAPAVTTVGFAPKPGITFAPRSEIVQLLQKPQAAPNSLPAPRAERPASARPSGGRFVVQIGAYDSAAIAESAWNRSVARIGMLRGYTPSTATIVRGAATYYRLSVTGFGTRATAASFCETLRSRGGQCFVRETAGDAPLLWANRGAGTRFAAR